MRAVVGLLVSSMLVGCVADVDEEEASDEQGLAAKSYSRMCVDTNGSTLDTAYAKQQGRTCVGRYLSFDGSHPALTREEANRLHAGGMEIFAIWEVSKYRALEGAAAGVADGKAAKTRMTAVGGGGKPVYFTVDFDLSAAEWDQKGARVRAYFDGVASVMGVARTGAYGTYVTIKELFDHHAITYGWQMTFGNKGKQIDGRAQLRQQDIYPSQTGWGVAGAGALDLDRAAKSDFGQW